MARHNATVVLSPVNGAQDDAVQDDAAQDGSKQEYVDRVSMSPKEDEIAEVLNSTSKRKPPMSGIWGKISGVIRKAANVPGQAENDGTWRESTSPAADAAAKMPSIVSSHPEPSKRKRYPEERDIYEMGLSDREIQETHPKRAKRGRPPGSTKSKDQSKPQPNIPKDRLIRSHKLATLEETVDAPRRIGRRVKNGQSATGNERELTVETSQPAKRRGRPPKGLQEDTLGEGTTEKSNKQDLETPTRERPASLGKEMAPVVEPDLTPPQKLQHDSLNITDGDGITSILENPSPIKPCSPVKKHPKTQQSETQDRASSGNHSQSRATTPPGDANGSGSEIDEDEDDEEEIEAVKSDLQSNQDANSEPPSEAEQEEYLLDPKILANMLERLRTVGCTYRNEEWRNVRKEPKMYTAPGKRLQRRLKRLNKAYKAMLIFKDAENEAGLDEEHSKAVTIIAELVLETSEILNTRLGPRNVKDKGATRTMLVDLYFNILPTLVEVLKNGVELYFLNGGLAIPALEEMTGIMKIICDLAEAAIHEPKANQPKAKKNEHYLIDKPTRQFLPELRLLLKNCLAEIKTAERQERIAKDRREAPERERRRKQREDWEAKERQKATARKLDEQRQILAKNIGFQSALPTSKPRPQSQPKSREQLARELEYAQERVRLEQERSKLQQNRLHEAELVAYKARLALERDSLQDGHDGTEHGLDPFDVDIDHEERVHLFGQKNNHQGNKPKEWSNEEINTLVDILKVRRGHPDLYQWLSQKLDRTYEELFEKVKDFKEGMQYLRKEKGQFIGPEHDWLDEI